MTKNVIPPLYGALLKNEQDVQLFERLAFMARRETWSRTPVRRRCVGKAPRAAEKGLLINNAKRSPR